MDVWLTLFGILDITSLQQSEPNFIALRILVKTRSLSAFPNHHLGQWQMESDKIFSIGDTSRWQCLESQSNWRRVRKMFDNG